MVGQLLPPAAKSIAISNGFLIISARSERPTAGLFHCAPEVCHPASVQSVPTRCFHWVDRSLAHRLRASRTPYADDTMVPDTTPVGMRRGHRRSTASR